MLFFCAAIFDFSFVRADDHFEGYSFEETYSAKRDESFLKYQFHRDSTYLFTDSTKSVVTKTSGIYLFINEELNLFKDDRKTIAGSFFMCDPHFEKPESGFVMHGYSPGIIFYARLVDKSNLYDYSRSTEFPLSKKNKLMKFEWNDTEYGKQVRQLPVRTISENAIPFVSVEYILRNVDFVWHGTFFVDTLHCGKPVDVAKKVHAKDSMAVAQFNMNGYYSNYSYDSLRRLTHYSFGGPSCNSCFDGFSFDITYAGNSGKPVDIGDRDYLNYKIFYDENGSVSRIEMWNYKNILTTLTVSE
ncbi:MAG: hypothetical protein HY064_06775 [Bacteroidetes bacterium]|nr:hypothetical protein [Bacteroidota bacterium]